MRVALLSKMQFHNAVGTVAESALFQERGAEVALR